MNAQLQALRARFNALASREKLMVIAAAAVIVLALVWLVAVGPALSTLGTADQQRRSIDAQLQRMAEMRTQAQAMQSQPKQSREEAMRQLENSVRQRLGTSARVMISGDRVTVTLTGTPADALAQWLAQARTAAHSLPGEAHLTRNASGLWEGNLVLILPRS
ncbi:MAG: type II secretion system protein GspM [Candidatus Dormibacteria bacterium]